MAHEPHNSDENMACGLRENLDPRAHWHNTIDPAGPLTVCEE